MYNVEKYIERCLVSIANQDLKNDDYEVICINDGSPDNSAEIAQSLSYMFGNFKLINIENGGLSNARNVGIKHCTGEFIYFIDSDDFLAYGALNLLLNKASAESLDFLGFSSIRTAESAISPVISLKPIMPVVTGFRFIDRFNYNNGACFFIFKREILTVSGLSFEKGKMCEDGPFTTELLTLCNRVSYTDSIVYGYYINAESITNNADQNHLVKLQSGFLYAIGYFNDKLNHLVKNKQQLGASRLKNRRDSYVFFYINRLINAQVDIKYFKAKLLDLKQTGTYPMKNFPGKDYPGLRYKIGTFIFNSPSLVCALLYAIRLKNKLTR